MIPTLTADQLLRIEALKAANEFYIPVAGRYAPNEEAALVRVRAEQYLAFLLGGKSSLGSKTSKSARTK